MRRIDITLRPETDEIGRPPVFGIVLLQKREGLRWRTKEVFVSRSDQRSSARYMLLEDDERVIVEPLKRLEIVYDKLQGSAKQVEREFTLAEAEQYALNVQQRAAGPLPDGEECQVGVWREAGDADWSRTGARYRTY